MGETDKQEFMMIMASTGELYEKEISKSVFQMYFSSLAEYDIKKIRKAFEEHIKTPVVGRYFPKPADIIDAIKKKQGVTVRLVSGSKYDFANHRPKTESERFELGYSEICILRSGAIPPGFHRFTPDEIEFLKNKYGVKNLLN